MDQGDTASKCGFTPRYGGLEALYRELGERGLVVLGFPSNQFGAQEPGNEEEISIVRLSAVIPKCPTSPRAIVAQSRPISTKSAERGEAGR